jgi:lipid-binding SYLF domain-containing protein
MKRFISLLALLVLIPLSARAADVSSQRDSILKMRDATLTRLYEVRPEARQDIQSAKGYAVFTSGSLALFYVGGGYGHGVAHDNSSGSDTYMQMAELGVGLGLGAKDARTIFVFHDAKAFHDFATTGLDLTGKADLAAKVGQKGAAYGGSADILPGVRVYQLTKTGLMAQAMVQGTKYWVDGDLNEGLGYMGSNTVHTKQYGDLNR